MRAKEKLEVNRKEFDYYEHVQKSIKELYPLRTDKQKTEDYFSMYLYADARCRKYIKSCNEDHEKVNFLENKGEINHLIAYMVRKEIQNAISEDNTFLYAYNIIERDHNPYVEDHNGKYMNLKTETLTSSIEIEEEIICYKEDYPKTNLADFMLDSYNFDYFSQNQYDLLKDDDWWLFVFNMAYEIFDRVRILLNDPFKAQYLVKNLYFNDKIMEKTIVEIVQNLISNYTY